MKKEEIEKLDIILREVEMDEYLNEETLPKIREALGIMHKIQQYQTKDNWISVDERLPEGHNELNPTEMEVIGFNEKWICPDFNPNGTRICVYSYGWTCARWNDSKDSYISDSYWNGDENTAPTHWQPLPKPPVKK